MSSTCADHSDTDPEMPAGYTARHEWAMKKLKTHNQFRCAECGLFRIWTPKPKRKKKR